MADERWAEENAVFEAEAALRRQQADIDDILVKVGEAQDLMARARAELDAEADDSRADREQEEKEARSGAVGAARRALQRRRDRAEPTGGLAWRLWALVPLRPPSRARPGRRRRWRLAGVRAGRRAASCSVGWTATRRRGRPS